MLVLTTSKARPLLPNPSPVHRHNLWLKEQTNVVWARCAHNPTPTLFCMFIFAPFVSKNSTRSTCPLLAAWWRGLFPICIKAMKTNDSIKNIYDAWAAAFCWFRLESSSHTEIYLLRSSSTTSDTISTTVYIGKSDTNPHYHAYLQNSLLTMPTTHCVTMMLTKSWTTVILITPSHIQK